MPLMAVSRSYTVVATEYAPLRIEVPAEPTNLAHAIKTSLAKLVFESCSFAASVSPWVLFPAWVGLAMLVPRSDLPIAVNGPS